MECRSWLTGGYSGAFGFLDPAHKDKGCFAPNLSFDFSPIEFQNMTPAQAEAKWAAEFGQITGKGSTPIIQFPWHIMVRRTGGTEAIPSRCSRTSLPALIKAALKS